MNDLVRKKPEHQYLWVKWRIQVLLLKRFDAASRVQDISLAEFAAMVTRDVQELNTSRPPPTHTLEQIETLPGNRVMSTTPKTQQRAEGVVLLKNQTVPVELL